MFDSRPKWDYSYSADTESMTKLHKQAYISVVVVQCYHIVDILYPISGRLLMMMITMMMKNITIRHEQPVSCCLFLYAA